MQSLINALKLNISMFKFTAMKLYFFNRFNYGVGMKKSFSKALLITVSVSTLVHAAENIAPANTDNFKLDEEKVSNYQINEAINDTKEVAPSSKEVQPANEYPKIIEEKTANGRIEKLVDENGRVLAQKTIENDKVIQKVLNYYHPNGKLSRQITADEDGGYYAEEFYSNGKISSQAAYLSEGNKIGKEQKYDSNGVVRQEIFWGTIDEDKDKAASQRRTERKGKIITYYPNRIPAAIFPVDGKGNTTFYSQDGSILKTIEDSQVLNFSRDIYAEDCPEGAIKLSLEELVELYEDEGDISYNACGMPYRETFVYELIDDKGIYSTKISYDSVGMVRRITLYKLGLKDGITQKFDASGNLIAEINYKNGVKDGYATGYFPTREVAFRKRYVNGKVEGALKCYFPNGKEAAEFQYKDGKKQGTAHIYSPVAKELNFVDNELQNIPQNTTARKIISSLSRLDKIDDKCVNFTNKKEEIIQKVAQNEDLIDNTFAINIPESCHDTKNYISENSKKNCYDGLNKLRVSLPILYERGKYVIGEIYSPDGIKEYSTSYKNKQLNGWSKKYDSAGNHIADIYFENNELADNSRSYYSNGAVKNMLSIADGKDRKVLTQYNQDGSLHFSLSYKDGKKNQAIINDNNKDTYIYYYDGELDKIRETNVGNPLNFVEYNLALNEYSVYKNGDIVRGGKLCAPKENTVEIKEKTTVITPQKIENKAVVIAEESKQPVDLAQKVKIEDTKQETEIKETTADAVVSKDKKVNTEVENNQVQEPIEVKPANVITKEKTEPNTANKITLPTPEVKVEKDENNPAVQPIKPTINLPPVKVREINNINEITPEYKVENAIIPTAKDKKKQELASQNIGPVEKPAINELTDTVAKEKVDVAQEKTEISDEEKTEKLYYPNGNLRKTIRTKNRRTEEVKEYSKTGLLLTDTIYGKDAINIEKYYGSGKIRRKTNKAYTDNTVMAFVSREDFYDNGNSRYEIKRLPDELIFEEKSFYPDGTIKSDATQTNPLSITTNEYNKNGNLLKTTKIYGNSILIKEYNADKSIKSITINGKEIPENLANNDEQLLKDNAKIYNQKGVLQSEIKENKNNITLYEYYSPNKVKSEMVFYNNGEISVKEYAKNGELEKFAYLSPDGKLHIQKPAVRTLPNYRERYWVDYNNPNWIENKDIYSINSISRLYLDTASYIMADIKMEVPESIKKIYSLY